MSKNYSKIGEELDVALGNIFESAPGPMQMFAGLMEEANKEGALTSKTKELMAVAISICVRCEGCVVYHTRAAHGKGATRQEILETIAIAVEMGGGPSMVYGADVLQAYDQFAAEAKS